MAVVTLDSSFNVLVDTGEPTVPANVIQLDFNTVPPYRDIIAVVPTVNSISINVGPNTDNAVS